MFKVDDFYTRFPQMTPYIVDCYETAKVHNCALLVIGESHYMPANSTIHKDPDHWYQANQSMLSKEEQSWISTRDIIAKELPKKIQNSAKFIWKYGYRKINEFGPKFEDYCESFKYSIIYNFYLRPANEGNSFKELIKPCDNEIANSYFEYMIAKFNPCGIIFLSMFAYNNCEKVNKLKIPVAATPHPCSQWWNRRSGKYGGKFGRDLVHDGMKGMDWSWAKQQK